MLILPPTPEVGRVAAPWAHTSHTSRVRWLDPLTELRDKLDLRFGAGVMIGVRAGRSAPQRSGRSNRTILTERKGGIQIEEQPGCVSITGASTTARARDGWPTSTLAPTGHLGPGQ